MPALRRREFITLLGGAIVWPLSARAQQPLVGFMSSRAPDDSIDVVVAFRRGLGERGVIEGRNVLVEFRWANGDYARLPALSARALSCHSPVRRLAQPEIPGRRAAGAGTVRSGAHSRSADRISECQYRRRDRRRFRSSGSTARRSGGDYGRSVLRYTTRSDHRAPATRLGQSSFGGID